MLQSGFRAHERYRRPQAFVSLFPDRGCGPCWHRGVVEPINHARVSASAHDPQRPLIRRENGLMESDLQGYLDVCTDSYVAGWATADSHPAELDVFVNDQHVQRICCKVERPELKLHGIPVNAGFLFNFPYPLQASDEVSVRFPDGTHLTNSPVGGQQALGQVEQQARQIVIVTGMHRSGTSLCSNLAAVVGTAMSEDIEISPNNPRGKWERKEIIEFHDRLLRQFERGWSDARHCLSLPAEWLTEPAIGALRDEMVDWLGNKLLRARHFGFKDPRTVRLLPLWDEICAELHLEPRYVFCIRDPGQVIRSLMARDGLEPQDAEYRWMVYNSHAIHGIGDRPACIIPYEDWFLVPTRTLARLAAHLNAAPAADSATVQHLANEIIDPCLRHDDDSVPSLGPLTKGLYEAVLETAKHNGFGSTAREAAAAFIGFEQFVQPMLTLGFGTSLATGRSATDPSRWGLSPDIIERARSGDLFAQMDIKNALVIQLPVFEGFEVYRQMLDLSDTHRIEPRSVRSLHDFTLVQAVHYTAIAPGGEPFSIAPAPVVGEGNHRTLKGLSRPLFLACLPNARVCGRSACIEAEEALVLDYQGDELARLDDRLEFDPAIFHAQGSEVWRIAPDGNSDAIELDEAFTLLGPHTYDFGHWMWEYLPKYIAASLSKQLPPVPLLIDADMPRTHRQTLERMAQRNAPLIEIARSVTARVGKLWCAPSQMHMPLLERMNERFKWDYLGSPPARFVPVIREMVRRVQPALSAKDAGSERIFLARRRTAHRKLVNYPVIEAVVQARGFRIIYPEALDFVEQVRLLRDARFVAGPEGSAFFLAFFSKPGTRLCILDHSHTAGLPLLTGLLEAIGVDCTIFTGPYTWVHPEWPHMSDYQIDEVAFCRFLDEWLRGDRR